MIPVIACLLPSVLRVKKNCLPQVCVPLPLTVIPLSSEKMEGGFDIFLALLKSLKIANVKLRDGDVLVVSAKFVSNSEGRLLCLNDIRVSESGRHMSELFVLPAKVAEVICRESDEILGGMAGFLISTSAPFAPVPVAPLHVDGTLKNFSANAQHQRSYVGSLPSHGILAPNAGIDMSNAKKGRVILYPSSPYETAEMLRRKIFLYFGVQIGVILADSRLMPTRVGTSAVAVAYAGMNPVTDNRSKPDLDGNPLKVTFQATSDNIATVANYVMGEGAESRPFAVVRDSEVVLTGRHSSPSATAVPADQCVYVRGLSTRVGR